MSKHPRGGLVVTVLIASCAAIAVPATAAPHECFGKKATIVGTERADELRGTERADVIVALGGGDTIRARRGNDRVCAGRGEDVIHGGSGWDSLATGPGAQVQYPDGDRAHGGAGRDRLFGSAYLDRLRGGPGMDTLRGLGARANECDCEGKVEQLFGGAGNDVIKGGVIDGFYTGKNLFRGGPGDDTIVGNGGALSDNDDGTYDTIEFVSGPVVVDLGAGSATGEGTDTLSGIETVYGSPGGDTITGDDTANILRGDLGDDTLVGRAGDDDLDGGQGVNANDGGDGTDNCVNPEIDPEDPSAGALNCESSEH